MIWVWKKAEGEPYEFTPRGDKPQRCPICGQYFRKGEKAIVIVPPMAVRGIHKKFSQNMMVHRSEWESFSHGITDDEAMATALLKHKTPRKLAFTAEEVSAMDAFVSACHFYRFYGERDLPYGKRCNRQGTGYLEYNVYTDTIDFVSRVRKPGLFDFCFEREIVAKVFNKMHELLGDEKRDNYTAAEVLQNIANDVNKIMKDIT